MESILVKDMMVPLADYATVNEDATLAEAVIALQEAQEHFDQNRYKHRAILVYNNKNQIVGKVSQLDVLRSLEPKYESLDDLNRLALLHVDVDYIRKMMDEYGLMQKPMDDICRKAATIKVKDIMHIPAKGEHIAEDATLNEASHQLIVGAQQSLLVTRGNNIVGVIRLSDVFQRVSDLMAACAI